MKNSQSGQIIIIALTFMVVLVFLAGALLGFVGQNVLGTRGAVAGEQALQLADAGIDKAIWELNDTAGSYTGETGTVLGAGVFDVTVTNVSSSIKEITAIGYVPNKSNPRKTVELKVQASIDTESVSFNFGLQVGDGGLKMENSSSVVGNVFSNGVIDGTQNARITGDAFSAGPTGRIFDDLQIDGNAHAHTIDDGVSVGGNALGQTMDDITVGGNVFTNSISNCTVGGNVDYTSISNCSVGGSQNPGYPGEPDPVPVALPITDEQISDWKTQAAAGGTIVGDYQLSGTDTATLGPKKITGKLTIQNSAKLTLSGPLWIQGDIELKNSAQILLDTGKTSEVVVGDGSVEVQNNVVVVGTGSDKYVIMVTTSSADGAFQIKNSAAGLIVYAPNGEIEIQNGAAVRTGAADRIFIKNSSSVTYETGLASIQFSGGPGASWQVVRGTWREIK